MIKLAIVTARPVYYYIPLFRLLANHPKIDLTVVYTTGVGTVNPTRTTADLNFYLASEEELTGYKYIVLPGAERIESLQGLRRSLNWNVVPHLVHERYDAVWIHGYTVGSNMLAALVQSFILRGQVLLRDDQHLRNHRSRWKQTAKKVLLPRIMIRWKGLYVGTLNREWMRFFGVREENLYFVPHAVEMDRLAVSSKNELGLDLEGARRSRDSEGKPFRLLSVGRLVWHKDYPTLLRAFALLQEVHSCTLTIVGDGPERAALEDLICELGVGGVELVGEVRPANIHKFYREADVFVLSSVSETWGLVVNEAMAFSLPIIVSSNVGCEPDLVLDGINGYTFAPGDYVGLAEELMRLAEDVDRRTIFGAESRKIVEHWTYEQALSGAVAALA